MNQYTRKDRLPQEQEAITKNLFESRFFASACHDSLLYPSILLDFLEGR